MKSRFVYFASFCVGFAVAFSLRAGSQVLQIQRYGQQRYQQGHTDGVEEVRREAVTEGHASYFDRDGDMRSEFRWNAGRPEWTGGAGMGATDDMPPCVVSLLQ